MSVDLITQLPSSDAIQAALARRRENRISSFFPDTGPYRRELYPRHIRCFAEGLTHTERLFIAANRVGKTIVGGTETVFHATGLYPHWWPGYRFDHPVTAWACNESWTACRDINQRELLGKPGEFGTGLIPKSQLIDWKAKSSVTDGVELIYVKHVTGGRSIIQFKSYEQKRNGFQGTAQDFIWADEEIPIEVYSECRIRTMTTGNIDKKTKQPEGGRILLTYTPIMGMTEVTMSFFPGGQLPESFE